MKRTYYYSDELNDDFAGTNIKRKEQPLNYKYFTLNHVRQIFRIYPLSADCNPLIFLFRKLYFMKLLKTGGPQGLSEGRIFSIRQSHHDRRRRWPSSSLSRKRRISSSTPTAYPSPSRERL
ncbi:MAG: hypothetical protein ACLRSW_10850 [Christensenellaceae bacterium]